MTPRHPAPPSVGDVVRHTPWLLGAAAAVAAAVLLMAILGDAIEDGAQFSFDRAILLWARGGSAHGVPIGPDWFRAAMVVRCSRARIRARC